MGIGLRYHPWASVSFYQQISKQAKEKILAQRGYRIRFPWEMDRDFFSLWAPINQAPPNKWFFFLSMSDFFAFSEYFSDENGIILMESGSLIVSVYL